MIRFLVTYDRPADPEAFDRHYRTVHAPLTRRLPRLLAYTVHRQPRAVRGAAYYQVVELTWQDRETAEAAFASPEGRATAADMANLDAPTRSCLYEVLDQPPDSHR
ncbi:EthD family reductase [Jatrophihabitans lederbergiae]|uniref:EthD family reductase n=1 Tax=Jatrophihabitans lederbergiae TaxID=3075547 RepID=A0ABU2JF90_9ACTN|nr:EthD family reductase [Jatrophihabitans sp. DSM 44399]MDT0263671.1 EthD family reductase [Jatrophihabitans sp. DSM 44399]